MFLVLDDVYFFYLRERRLRIGDLELHDFPFGIVLPAYSSLTSDQGSPRVSGTRPFQKRFSGPLARYFPAVFRAVRRTVPVGV